MNQVKFQTTAAHRHQLAISGAASLISIDHGPPPGTCQGLWVTGTAHEGVQCPCECDHVCVMWVLGAGCGVFRLGCWSAWVGSQCWCPLLASTVPASAFLPNHLPFPAHLSLSPEHQALPGAADLLPSPLRDLTQLLLCNLPSLKAIPNPH